MIGGVLHIGPEPDGDALLNYVLDSASPLVPGGAFGVEASLPSIAVYPVSYTHLDVYKRQAPVLRGLAFAGGVRAILHYSDIEPWLLYLSLIHI